LGGILPLSGGEVYINAKFKMQNAKCKIKEKREYTGWNFRLRSGFRAVQ
jgi:hypothetical protein